MISNYILRGESSACDSPVALLSLERSVESEPNTYVATANGCDATGQSDCHSAIEAIIDTITAKFKSSRGNKVVEDTSVIYFPPGEYRLTAPVIKLLDAVNDYNTGVKLAIRGAGADQTRFVIDNDQGAFNLVHGRHEGSIEFSDLAVVTKPANKSVSGVLRDPEYGIYVECLDFGFATQDRMAVLKNLRLGWDEERGNDWQIGNVNANGFLKKGITLLGYYIPLLENITIASRIRQDNLSTMPAAVPDSWGICVDNCYGGVITACNLNVNHHQYGIKDTWYNETKEPKGEGGHISDCNIQARIGFSRRRWNMKPHLTMYSNHFNTSEICIDIVNVSEAIISDTVIINDQFGGSNYGFNIGNCQRVQISKVTYSYGQVIDYSENRAFNLSGNAAYGQLQAYPLQQVIISDYQTFYAGSNPPAGFANVWGGCSGIEVREDHFFEYYYPGSASYPNYWILNGSAGGFFISRS